MPPQKAAAKDPKKTMKLVVAIGLFVVAGVVVALQQGLFSSGDSAAGGARDALAKDRAESAKAQEAAQQRVEQIKTQGGSAGGTD